MRFLHLDEAAQVIRRGEGSAKMVKNERGKLFYLLIWYIPYAHSSTHVGLWVKAKEEATLSSSSSTTNTSLKGAGRGGGIPVFNPMHKVDSRDEGGQAAVCDEFDYKAKKKRDNDRHDDPDSEQVDLRDRYRDASRDRVKRDRSPARSSRIEDNERYRRNSRDRDRSRDRHYHPRDSRDRDSSYNKRPRSDRDDSRDRRDTGRDRYESSSSTSSFRRADDREHSSGKRHRSRSPSPVSRRDSKPLPSNQEGARSSRHTDDDNSSVAILSDEDAVPFTFSAIQIVNRFLEVFASPTATPAQRLDSIIDLFDEQAVIASLKTEKPLLTGIEAIRTSFAKTTATTGIECSRRLYIPYKPTPNTTNTSIGPVTGTGTGTGIDSKYSYTLDFHTPGSSPGLGDPNKDTVLLYQCNENTSKIVHIWGTVDTDILASKVVVSENDVYKCNVWKWVLLVLQKQEPEVEIGTREMYFHDYTNIETI